MCGGAVGVCLCEWDRKTQNCEAEYVWQIQSPKELEPHFHLYIKTAKYALRSPECKRVSERNVFVRTGQINGIFIFLVQKWKVLHPHLCAGGMWICGLWQFGWQDGERQKCHFINIKHLYASERMKNICGKENDHSWLLRRVSLGQCAP